MAKKRDPNKVIFNFSINGVTVMSHDDFGDWHLLKKSDDHFDPDPNDILGKKNAAENLKFEELAKTANGVAGEILPKVQEIVTGKKSIQDMMNEKLNDPLNGLR